MNIARIFLINGCLLIKFILDKVSLICLNVVGCALDDYCYKI